MIRKLLNNEPNVHKSSFVAESADVIGNIKLGEDCNIWFSTVLRGDTSSISVGNGTNIQDNSTVHGDDDFPTSIGSNVTVGHNCIIHGCTIENNVLVGMGSTILNGAEIGENTIIGACSLVTQGKKIPSGVLCMGSPVKVVRELTDEEIRSIKVSAEHYVALSKTYK